MTNLVGDVSRKEFRVPHHLPMEKMEIAFENHKSQNRHKWMVSPMILHAPS
jgi:hypothetical protein